MQEADQREVSVGYSTQRFTLFFSPALPEKRGGRNKRSCLLNGRSAGLDCQRRFLPTSLSSHSPTLCPTLSLSLLLRFCSTETRHKTAHVRLFEAILCVNSNISVSVTYLASEGDVTCEVRCKALMLS